MILPAPFCSLTHFAPYHFYTGFNGYFYEKHLTDQGFEILDIVENGNFFKYLGQEINRISYVAERYSDDKINTIIEKISIKIVLNMLSRFSKKDMGSKEFLCFGYHHILARKRK